jgi:hypothetical protein
MARDGAADTAMSFWLRSLRLAHQAFAQGLADVFFILAVTTTKKISSVKHNLLSNFLT